MSVIIIDRWNNIKETKEGDFVFKQRSYNRLQVCSSCKRMFEVGTPRGDKPMFRFRRDLCFLCAPWYGRTKSKKAIFEENVRLIKEIEDLKKLVKK